ncbi:unnamed protein product [Scytosiphon promiscuus]
MSVWCEIQGRTYELRPALHGPCAAQTAASPGDGSWSCQSVINLGGRHAKRRPRSSTVPAVAAEVPLRESSGLLWAWPDTSPEGIAAAALADPAPVLEFSTSVASEMSRGGLFRHQSTDKSEDVGTNSDRRRAVVLQREVDYGYADTVGGLLATSHGRAVQAAATRRKRRAMDGDELEVAITSLRSEAGSSPGSFRGSSARRF